MEPALQPLQAGDPQAWRRVYPVLWGIALAAAGQAHPALSPQDREDVAIESITALMERIGQVKTVAQLRSLVAVIAHHKAIDLARQRFSQKQGGGKVESLEAVTAATGDSFVPQEVVQQAETLADLHAALQEVRESWRQRLVDRFLNGLDYKELAAQHGLGEGSVGVYLKRGLDELRGILARNPARLKEIQEQFRYE